ncbi:hypothetical protein K4043_02830 [Stenotrophomonas sp. SRS1]|uniref:hypothetical protein n=1 Tax=Stenotrophomonas sp. SRS1 TaxID=2870345 RepID=UPI002238E3B4|nr:hypothetical protein [Stenotrophomonas sp. SRS1]MCW6026949.1 hypothetical protein [Stenotrophomonas sp. SRS1]
MNDTLAFTEIHDLHVLIEDWFTGRSPVAALGTLLARFSEDFSMVGIRGIRLDKPALADLFASAHGSRPGLQITVDAMQYLPLAPAACAVRYREDQIGADGTGNRREALAVLVSRPDGTLRWQALHETVVGG